jgi:hypothetical protein
MKTCHVIQDPRSSLLDGWLPWEELAGCEIAAECHHGIAAVLPGAKVDTFRALAQHRGQ